MDGPYDSNKNFKYLYEKKILPGIKIKKNSITSTKKNTKTRNKERSCITTTIFIILCINVGWSG
jgi:hypothetical protein